MTGYGECAACGNPMDDGEMFCGELCTACAEEWRREGEIACPAAGGIPCGAQECVNTGVCLEEL